MSLGGWVETRGRPAKVIPDERDIVPPVDDLDGLLSQLPSANVSDDEDVFDGDGDIPELHVPDVEDHPAGGWFHDYNDTPDDDVDDSELNWSAPEHKKNESSCRHEKIAGSGDFRPWKSAVVAYLWLLVRHPSRPSEKLLGFIWRILHLVMEENFAVQDLPSISALKNFRPMSKDISVKTKVVNSAANLQDRKPLEVAYLDLADVVRVFYLQHPQRRKALFEQSCRWKRGTDDTIERPQQGTLWHPATSIRLPDGRYVVSTRPLPPLTSRGQPTELHYKLAEVSGTRKPHITIPFIHAQDDVKLAVPYEVASVKCSALGHQDFNRSFTITGAGPAKAGSLQLQKKS
eukprot:m.67121 g.67121  ORF g.67121 m.67121 type:complete len:346 (+) comp14075_c0_seq10:96-1133(+)